MTEQKKGKNPYFIQQQLDIYLKTIKPTLSQPFKSYEID